MTNTYKPTSRKKLAGGLSELDPGGEHPSELDRGLAELDHGLILTQNILRR